MRTTLLAGLVLLSGPAPSALAADAFRPWNQAHWEVDEGSGLPTPAMTTGTFRPWIQAHWEVDEGSGLPTPAMTTGTFRPWAQAHWELADEPASDGNALPTTGELADR